MILIGRYLSPFVRRVGATLCYHGIDFEHRALRAAGDEQDEIRKSNPLGRVPALVLDDGKVLADSAVMVEYIDDLVGPSKALAPASGWARYEFNSLLSIATGAAEKAIAAYMEPRNRPEEKVHQAVIDNAARQARDGFEYLDNQTKGEWMYKDKLSQLDISTACYWAFVKDNTPEVSEGAKCPKIEALVARLGATDWFAKTAP